MQKVVSISLNGIAYQLEEPGYNLLRDYLERAELRLKDSPDRPEVMADLEQAIGEKCRATLGPHKTVVNTAEVERLIAEMGPVESPDGKGADSTFEGSGATTSAGPAPHATRMDHHMPQPTTSGFPGSVYHDGDDDEPATDSDAHRPLRDPRAARDRRYGRGVPRL
jgi:hypothetical protein